MHARMHAMNTTNYTHYSETVSFMAAQSTTLTSETTSKTTTTPTTTTTSKAKSNTHACASNTTASWTTKTSGTITEATIAAATVAIGANSHCGARDRSVHTIAMDELHRWAALLVHITYSSLHSNDR